MSISTLLMLPKLLFNIKELSRYTVLVSQPLYNYFQSNLYVIIYIWTEYQEYSMKYIYSTSQMSKLSLTLHTFSVTIVVTTRQNGTCSLLTSAKLSVSYLVGGIIRELDKEPLLHCDPIYINYMWSILQQCLTSIPALKASCLSYVYSAVTVQECASCPNIHVYYMQQQCGENTP